MLTIDDIPADPNKAAPFIVEFMVSLSEGGKADVLLQSEFLPLRKSLSLLRAAVINSDFDLIDKIDRFDGTSFKRLSWQFCLNDIYSEILVKELEQKFSPFSGGTKFILNKSNREEILTRPLSLQLCWSD